MADRLAIAMVLAWGAAFAAEAEGPPAAHTPLRTLDLQLATPHLPLLKRHARGELKAFFLTPAGHTLAHVREFVQRADIAADYFAVARPEPPADGQSADHLAELQKKIASFAPQVLVTLGIPWHAGLKAQLAGELLGRVRDGMGAVLVVRDPKDEPELAAALAGLRELAEPPLPSAAVSVPPVRRYALGKGRVALVVCPWRDDGDAGAAALGEWATLRLLRETARVAELRWRGFEYSYAFLADLARWAAGQDTPIVVTEAALKGNVVAVGVRNAGGKAKALVQVTLRSRRWEVRTDGAATVDLPEGESQHLVTLGKAPDSGPLGIEVHVRDGDGRTVAFGTAGASAYGAVTMKVAPQPSAYQPAEQPGACIVELAGATPGGRLEVSVLDRFGRLVARSVHDVRLTNGRGQAGSMLREVRALDPYHEVVARFYSAEEPPRLLAEATADLFLLPPRSPAGQGFALGVWGAARRDPLHLQGLLAATHDGGLTLHSGSDDDAVLYATGGVKAATVELPVAKDLAAADGAKADWQKQAREQFDSGARLIALGGERRVPEGLAGHPQVLAAFREWLKPRYADIAELNRAWGAQFADFAQVVPRERRDPGTSPNVAPWLEFRLFLGEWVGERYLKAPAAWAAEIAPELAVGEWATAEPSDAWPVDWSRYATCCRGTVAAGGRQGVLEELFRCFAPGARFGVRLDQPVRAPDAPARLAPWLALLNGGSLCWAGDLRDVATPDLRPAAAYATLAKEEFRDLTEGIDRLILASAFAADKIAIGYSYPSWLADSAALARGAKTLVEELGFQHDLVTMDDVAAGRLEKDGYRLFLLEQASCLSSEQAEGVKRFAEAGGVVLCLGRNGWRNLRGTPHPEGCLLDPLAGVDTAQATPLGKTMAASPGGPSLTLDVALAGVQAKDASVLAGVSVEGKDLPVWTVRDAGKGKVYWLNARLALDGGHAVQRAQWELLDHVVAMAGVKPRCRLFQGGQPVFGAETWYYESPSKRTLIVARHVSPRMEGHANVRFDRKAHVYELRTHRYFGETDQIQDTFPEGTVRLYALTDCKLQKPMAKAEEGRHEPGSAVRVQCHMLTYGKEVEVDLVPYRLQVFDASGRELAAYRRVVLAPGGKHTFELPLALDHPPGRQSVVITDPFTGQEARAYFLVAKVEEKKR